MIKSNDIKVVMGIYARAFICVHYAIPAHSELRWIYKTMPVDEIKRLCEQLMRIHYARFVGSLRPGVNPCSYQKFVDCDYEGQALSYFNEYVK